MNKPTKAFPKFSDEAEERAYLENGKARRHRASGLGNGQEGRTAELEAHNQDDFTAIAPAFAGSLKVAANARDVAPYQSLMKVWLQKKLHSQ
jgi:hypothetical protein